MTGFARALPFGAALLPAGGVRFHIWAPHQAALQLEIADAAPLAMARDSQGWFTLEAPYGAGVRYRFRLADGQAVPDPAARQQAGDVHGWSVVVDPRAYRWRTAGWQGRPWHEAVICELHVGICGGYAGTAERLPALATLGVTAIELMPVAEFPGNRSWGYDGVLPFAPDAAYGTPEELKALVDRAHELGLMVLLDVVYNHFGPDGNYLGLYAKDFFRNDVQTPWGVAIDFRRAEVQRYFAENALYWLMEYRFDGLRFDAAQAIAAPAWLDALANEVRSTVEPGRHVHLVLEHEMNAVPHLEAGFTAQWNDDFHHVVHHLLTGEAGGYYVDYRDRPAERLARCLRDGFIYQGDASAFRGGRARGAPSGHLPPTAFISFLQNHDQIGNRAFGERLNALCPPEALRAAIALLLLAPQIPMFFIGDEHGSRAPFLYFTDHGEDLAEAVREGRRREFADFDGFADPEARARIPDPNALATFEASHIDAQPDDAAAWSRHWGELLTIRHTEIVPRLPGARAREARPIGDKAVQASWQMGDGTRLHLLANLGPKPVEAPRIAGRLLYPLAATQSDALAAFTTRVVLEA